MDATKDGELDLEKLEALEKAATPGPWKGPLGKRTPYVGRYVDDAYGSVQVAECGYWKDNELARFNLDRWLADAAFIAALRNAAPDLIASARALAAADARIARLELALCEIRDANPVDMALDPEWPARIAGAAIPRPR